MSEITKTKTELREIAKERLLEALSVAYYAISDNPSEYGLTEEEAELVTQEYMNQYGKTMAKAIGKEFYTA